MHDERYPTTAVNRWLLAQPPHIQSGFLAAMANHPNRVDYSLLYEEYERAQELSKEVVDFGLPIALPRIKCRKAWNFQGHIYVCLADTAGDHEHLVQVIA